jgi:serine/threonine protein kinase
MAVATASALLEALAKFQLLSPDQLEEAACLQSKFPDPKALANELFKKGWLTSFQASHVFKGTGDKLVLGSYILIDRLGEGAMGQVYKARHKTMGRIVALKVIRKDKLSQKKSVQRFEREIRAVAQLSHPNIVMAYDADQVNGTRYIAMEYVPGIDLAQLVGQTGPLPIMPACEYIRQAALGLQHAHERGLVHRDIKPSNLLLSADGTQVKLLDMGLARLNEMDEDAGHLTQEGFVMGTPDFLAPEQARDSHKADIRSDLYSLGCSMYFLLSGQVPFPGRTLHEKVMGHVMGTARPLEQLRPDVPGPLLAVVRRLMAKLPEERYQTPAVLAEDLEHLLQTGQLPSNSTTLKIQNTQKVTPNEVQPVVRPVIPPVPAGMVVAAPPAPSGVVRPGASVAPPAPSGVAITPKPSVGLATPPPGTLRRAPSDMATVEVSCEPTPPNLVRQLATPPVPAPRVLSTAPVPPATSVPLDASGTLPTPVLPISPSPGLVGGGPVALVISALSRWWADPQRRRLTLLGAGAGAAFTLAAALIVWFLFPFTGGQAKLNGDGAKDAVQLGPPAVQDGYAKRDTREETILATLRYHKVPTFERFWHVAGPFPNASNVGYSASFPCEGKERIDLGMSIPRKDEETSVRWRELRARPFRVGKPNDVAALMTTSLDEDSFAFLFVEFDNIHAMVKLPVALASDGPVKAWHNGVEVFASPRRVLSDLREPAFHLNVIQRRQHQLLLKVCQHRGPWSITVLPLFPERLEREQGPKLLRDFPR